MTQSPTMWKVCAVVVTVVMAPVALGNDRGDGADRNPSPGPAKERAVHREAPDDPPLSRSLIEAVGRGSPAGVWRRGDYASVQVNVNPDGDNIVGDAANEPSIAVDPTNPTRIAIGWRQFDTIASNFRQSGIAYSHDAGQTWTSPGATSFRLGVLEPGEFSSDPVLDFDAQGRFYYYALQPDRGPGDWACYLYRSDDGGATWPQEVYAWGGDKAWMAVDRTGGIGHGNLYFAWSPFAGCCGSGSTFTRSVDGGLSFLTPIGIPNRPRWGTLTVAPDGALYIAGGGSSNQFVVVRSTNAQDPSVTPFFDQVTAVDLGGGFGFGSDSSPNPGGLLGQVWIASDHSDGPRRGNLYVLASVDPEGPDPQDVSFIRSTDGGATWSDPVRVNDDPPGTNAWQWFGTMSVAPNGRIDVIWNDTRNSGVANMSELFYSYSLDAGATWSENVPVSPMFDSWVGWPNQNKIGDYYDMISDDFGASVAYSATFNGEQDVYYLRIGDLDCNGNGVPDAEDLAGGTSDDCDGNAQPDECDVDCNDNGLVDVCEIAEGVTADCDGNLVPDDCDPNFDGDEWIDGCDPDIDGDSVLNADDLCDFTPLGLPIGDFGVAIGDQNRDCIVNLGDFTSFVVRCLSFSGPGRFAAPFCTRPYDYPDDREPPVEDMDGDIDLFDFAGFQRAFKRR